MLSGYDNDIYNNDYLRCLFVLHSIGMGGNIWIIIQISKGR
jgi:hypothetical protein